MIKPFAIYFRIRGNILTRKSTPRYRRHGRVDKKAFTCCCNWPTKLIMNLLNYRSLLPLSGEQVEALPMLASREVNNMKQMPTTEKVLFFYHETT